MFLWKSNQSSSMITQKLIQFSMYKLWPVTITIFSETSLTQTAQNIKNFEWNRIFDCRQLWLLKCFQNWNFFICFVFMLYQVLFWLYISYLCYLFSYMFITYLYVHYMFFKFCYIFLFPYYFILNLCDKVFIFVICAKLL